MSAVLGRCQVTEFLLGILVRTVSVEQLTPLTQSVSRLEVRSRALCERGMEFVIPRICDVLADASPDFLLTRL